MTQGLRVFLPVLLFAGTCAAQTIDLNGTVTNASGGAAVANVNVSLKRQPGIVTTTGADGTYHLTFTGVARSQSGLRAFSGSRLNGDILEFSATGNSPVSIDIFGASGSKIATLTKDNVMAQGNYRLDLAAQGFAPGVYGIRYRQGSTSVVYRFVSTGARLGPARPAVALSPSAGFLKRTDAMVDTLIFALPGFATAQVPISSYSGHYDAVLTSQSDLPAGMKPIPSGTYTMGSNNGQDWGAAPTHQVTISFAFYMDTTEVTQTSFQAFMHVNPSTFNWTTNLPVDNVSWFDAVLYCNARSKAEGKDTVYTYSSVSGTGGNGCSGLGGIAIDYSKKGYRLPTEAEWEYACRAGTTTEFYWGDNMDGDYCWWYGNTWPKDEPVATKLPNSWGLYDMVGNEAEWCADWFAAYSDSAQTDPTGPSSGTTKMVRGGSWGNHDVPNFARTATRVNEDPSTQISNNGFRCALSR